MKEEQKESLAIVGKFMGKNFKDPENYTYDTDWNELILACKKWMSLQKKYNKHCGMLDDSMQEWEKEPVFKQLVENIKWHNEQNRQDHDKTS